MNNFLQEIGYGFKLLIKFPLMTISIVICLALGICAASTMFVIINTLLLKPLPFPDPDELVWIHEQHPKHHEEIMSVSYLNYLDWRARCQFFSQMGVFVAKDDYLELSEGVNKISMGIISPEIFRVLNIAPLKSTATEIRHLQCLHRQDYHHSLLSRPIEL